MTIKGRLAMAMVIAGLMTIWIGEALAAATELSLQWTQEGTKISIRLEKKDEKHYVLYLPGGFAGKDPVIRINKNTDLIWDDTKYTNGSTLPASRFIGKTVRVSFTNGRDLGEIQVMQGSAIPSVFFTVTGNDLYRVQINQTRDIKEPATVVMIDRQGKVNASESLSSFKARGNSTFYVAKKSFTFAMERKADLAGMGKNKKWVLLANWFDISLIRNQMTYDLCRELGLKSTPDCRPVDLYINGSYNGTYLMTEKIQLKKNRLEINDLEEDYEMLLGKSTYEKARRRKGSSRDMKVLRWFNTAQEPADLTGGYLLEIEKPLHFSKNKDNAGFVTNGQMCVLINEPTHAGKKAVDYISNLVNDFHNAVLAQDGINRDTGKYYAEYIDMRSFATKVAIEEFCSNYDVQAASHFMYKDRDSVDPLLYCGPAWDYDLTYGNKDDGMRNPSKVDYVFNRSTATSFLYHWLLTHDDFRKMVRQIWDDELQPAAEVLLGKRAPKAESPLKSIQAYRKEIAESAAMNFTRWSAGRVADITDESGRTFEDAGDYLWNWISIRTEALAKVWLKD